MAALSSPARRSLLALLTTKRVYGEVMLIQTESPAITWRENRNTHHCYPPPHPGPCLQRPWRRRGAAAERQSAPPCLPRPLPPPRQVQLTAELQSKCQMWMEK